MAFIKLHSDNKETLVNTDTVTFIQSVNEKTYKTQIFFNTTNGNSECLWLKVTETLDEIEELVNIEKNLMGEKF